LLRGLSGDDVVMAVEVEGAGAGAEGGEEGVYCVAVGVSAGADALAGEAEMRDAAFEEGGAGGVISARRIFGGDGDQGGEEGGHFVGAGTEPGEESSG